MSVVLWVAALLAAWLLVGILIAWALGRCAGVMKSEQRAARARLERHSRLR